MYLPVKLAASLPIGLAFVGGLLVSLASKEGRVVHPVYGFPSALLIAFFAAVVALLLVVPNIVGALLANRSGGSGFVAFAAIFSAAVILVAFAQFVAVNRLFGTARPSFDFADWRLYAVLAADIALMLGVAAWSGRSDA
ncbi:MAG: hypothetical protein ACO1OD_08575 [Croceibacterium sp.]